MEMDINTALDACENLRSVRQRLQVLKDLGLGYLTLGRRDSQPLRRGSSAAQAGKRDGETAGRFCLHI